MLLAESYLHSLDPYAIHISGDFGVRWYGLAYVVGFLLAWALALWLSKSHRSLIPTEKVGDMMMWIIGGVLVGGRLGYVLFYDPQLIFEFESSLPWWQLLAIHRGGMASHGGMIGVIVALLIFAKRNKIPLLHPIDVTAFICPPGLFLGRMANFINGELWGEPWKGEGQAPAWTVKYPEEIMVRPEDFELESLRPVIGGATSFHERVVSEVHNGNEMVISVVQPQLTAYFPSQLIQAISDGPVLLAAIALVWLRPRKPGFIAGSFLLFYGALRMITELYRQPDVGVAVFLGLSRGQQLSLIQILLGICLVLWSVSRRSKPIGGLLRPASV
jgi:phosphatidylglycerol:prolipoprotein diacylglycerol transferase